MSQWKSGLVVLGWLFFFGVGLVQLAAIQDFFQEIWRWPAFLALLAGAILAFLPVVGSICGLIAAIKVWHWAWWQAGLLFFWPALIAVMSGGVSFLSAVLHKKRY